MFFSAPTMTGYSSHRKTFLGEPYGWGGMNNARDCSALVMDVFRTFRL
ncbi:MAG: NlpC/P60 family protein [Clostridia bacterium]